MAISNIQPVSVIIAVLKMILYIDMDNVLVDFPSGVSRIAEPLRKEYEGRLDEVPGIFSLMEPMKDAVSSFQS